MSSKPEAQNEPTMEEILASIRRIISEDDPQDANPAEAAPSAPPTARAEPAAERAAAPAEPAPAPPVSGAGADNILDLTKMVADDGSIVDLKAEEAPQAASEDEAAPEEEAASEAPEAPAEEADEAAAEAEPEPEPAAEALEEAAEEVQAAAEEAAAEEAPEAEAQEEAAPADDAAEEDATEEEAAEEDAEAAGSRVPAPAGEGSDFVSALTAAAATASLAAVSKAAMANRQGDAIAIGGGRTLEDLVRQSLAPELKGWLDDNLPDLVERIVREEIRKMVRRAEDQ
jgi:hypothetical protein